MGAVIEVYFYEQSKQAAERLCTGSVARFQLHTTHELVGDFTSGVTMPTPIGRHLERDVDAELRQDGGFCPGSFSCLCRGGDPGRGWETGQAPATSITPAVLATLTKSQSVVQRSISITPLDG